jgi:hypothetical protein
MKAKFMRTVRSLLTLGKNIMTLETSAFVISTCALLFTLFSFWWMNWRKGKIQVGTPRTYAANGSVTNTAILELPLDFFNDGPTPIIIRNLRLVLPIGTQTHNFMFNACVDKLGTDTGRAFATQIVIRGREALVIIAEFQTKNEGLLFEAKTYQIELQAKLNHSTHWKTLHSFPLTVDEDDMSTINTSFIVHDNDKK